MRVYLDDVRQPPFGWELVKTADECIALLALGGVEELSLDHDLAPDHHDRALLQRVDARGTYDDRERSSLREKTGYDVVLWMIENATWPSLVILHSMNPTGREDMRRAIDRHAPAHVRLEVRVGWCRRTDG